MKKTCTMLLSLLLSLLMCMTALADTTSKNDMITIQNLIAERMNNEEIVLPQYDSLFVPFASKKITIKQGAHLLVSNPRKD